MRGYDYRALGPTDDASEVVGGRHLLAAGLEYDRRIAGDFGAALFYDAGAAFDRWRPDFAESLGFGWRWFSPIGPVRLDLAFPRQGGGVRLHISMGPDL